MDNVYSTIDVIIKAQKKARRENDYLTLMTNAEALLEFVPSLISFSIEQEGEYRKFESGMADEKDENGKRFSSAYAETKSKATSFYRDFQKAKMFIDFIYNMVNLSKKIASGVDTEMKSQV